MGKQKTDKQDSLQAEMIAENEAPKQEDIIEEVIADAVTEIKESKISKNVFLAIDSENISATAKSRLNSYIITNSIPSENTLAEWRRIVGKI